MYVLSTSEDDTEAFILWNKYAEDVEVAKQILRTLPGQNREGDEGVLQKTVSVVLQLATVMHVASFDLAQPLAYQQLPHTSAQPSFQIGMVYVRCAIKLVKCVVLQHICLANDMDMFRVCDNTMTNLCMHQSLS